MTREEVKAQLAKSPLEWTSSNDPDGKNVHTATIPMAMDPKNWIKYSIEYRVEEVDGYGDLELLFMNHMDSTGSSIAISMLSRLMYPM